MNAKEPTRTWLALFNTASITVTIFLTVLSLQFSGITNEPGFSDGTGSSPDEIAFLVVAILAPIGVILGVIMSQWKRSELWALCGLLASLLPMLLIGIIVVLTFIS